MQNHQIQKEIKGKLLAPLAIEALQIENPIYREVRVEAGETLEIFLKNLSELEDAVGRLKTTMRDVRFHMKMD